MGMLGPLGPFGAYIRKFPSFPSHNFTHTSKREGERELSTGRARLGLRSRVLHRSRVASRLRNSRALPSMIRPWFARKTNIEMVLLRCKLPPESRLVSRTYLLYCLLVIGIRFLHWYQSQHEFFEICFENIVGLCLGCLL